MSPLSFNISKLELKSKKIQKNNLKRAKFSEGKQFSQKRNFRKILEKFEKCDALGPFKPYKIVHFLTRVERLY